MLKVAVIILAAGASRRFGVDDKLVADLDGEPLITRVVREVSQVDVAGVAVELRVVVREGSSGVLVALRGLTPETRPSIVINPRAAEGMGTSIAAGVASLSADTDAAVIVPGDMPFIGHALIEDLIAAFVVGGGATPTHPVLADGTRVGPVVWPRTLFAALRTLAGETGGRTLLERTPTLGVPIGDPTSLVDIDTPADFESVIETLGGLWAKAGK
jgi:molybdenum cofactor cytidylyltransferase